MSAVGADSDSVNNVSTQTFTTSLITNAAVAGVQVTAFLIIFRLFPQIYEPRSFLPRKTSDRARRLPRSRPWQTLLAIWYSPEQKILQQNGLDAYLFLRFLKMLIRFFIFNWFFSWVILLPVDAVNSGGTKDGLERFTFGNVGRSHQDRYWAHLVLAYLFAFYAFYLINKNMAHFVQLRHSFLTSPARARLAQSKTVLVTGIPEEFRHVRALDKLGDLMPAGDGSNDSAEKIWLSRDIDTMVELYDRQVKAANKLEAAETTLMKNAAKAQFKAQKKLAKLSQKENKKGTSGMSDEQRNDLAVKAGLKSYDPEKELSVLDQLVDKSMRPTMRKDSKAWLPFFSGTKTDTIDWCKQELVEVTEALKKERVGLESKPAGSAAFLQFRTQIAAHIFAQSTLHHQPLQMAQRFTDVAPDDVIFGNLNMGPLQQRIRLVLSWLATLGLIIAWVFPVAFVGSLSNVNELCSQASWLRWLCDLPVPLNGIIQGLLPPVLLALLFLVLPIILRLLARFEGIPLKSEIELSLMTRYFIFLVIHGFLVVTLSSGLIAAIPVIAENPGTAVTDLAQNLPRASNFYLSYMVTTSLSGASGNFMRIVALILYYVLFFVLASTPRKLSRIQFRMPNTDWGTLFPNITLLLVIGTAYSIISPLMNGFATLAFFLFYYCYKYLFTFVYDMPKAGETAGRFFYKGITHFFVGLYIKEICLAGLFFLARNEQGNVSALPQAILMIILGFFTILFHVYIITSYYPLVNALPLDLALELTQEDMEGEIRLTQERKQLNRVKNVLDPVTRIKDVGDKSLARLKVAGDTVLKNPKFAGEAYAMSDLNPPDLSHQRSQAEEEGLEVSQNAFTHPAGWQEVKPIWLPADLLGLGAAEAAAIRALGFEATTAGAIMNEKGQTRITRPPPEEHWEESEHPQPAARDSTSNSSANASSPAQPGQERQATETASGQEATGGLPLESMGEATTPGQSGGYNVASGEDGAGLPDSFVDYQAHFELENAGEHGSLASGSNNSHRVSPEGEGSSRLGQHQHTASDASGAPLTPGPEVPS